jgi:long-chain fatty acid transport protein
MTSALARGSRLALAVALGGLVCAAASTARAGGLFTPTRGVRPTARGGAFVAGADDLGALWFNPAGIAAHARDAARGSLLVDGAIVDHDVSYTRIDSGGVTQPTVHDDPQLVPIPTLAAGVDLSRTLTLGVGLLVPYTALDAYPETGAQRYSLVNLRGSALTILELALAAKLGDDVWIGAGVQNMFLMFRSRLVFSACPREVFCAPEDPEFDSVGEIRWDDYFNPSAVAGVIWQPARAVKVGAAFQLPFFLSSNATARVRLPSASFYDGARVVGETAAVSMTIPMVARLGVEISPSPRLRVELGLDREFWSQHDEIAFEPVDIRVEDAAGVGVYDLGPMSIPRHLEDTMAARVGVEARPARRLGLIVRAGLAYETGGAPDEWLSVITVDSDKLLLAGGIGWQAGRVRIDATVAHVVVGDRDLAARTSCAPQLNPIRSGQEPAPPAPGDTCVHDGDPDRVYVGDGSYRSSWTIFGVGFSLEL